MAFTSIMKPPWLDKPFTFRALQRTFGPMWLRCDLCGRFVESIKEPSMKDDQLNDV
jgi:hypothetical protein